MYRLFYQYTHFLKLKSYICKFYFWRFSKIFQQQKKLNHYMLNKFPYHCLVTMTSMISVKFTTFINHILFSFRLNSFKIFWKALVIVIPFLSFKGTVHVYLLRASIKHTENRITLLNACLLDQYLKCSPYKKTVLYIF